MEPTLSPQAQAQRLGLPASLFGHTPDQPAYWHEPGLPWVTQAVYENPPADRRGGALVWHYATFRTQRMGPRFPAGCVVNVAPVYERANLVLGRVYFYRYQDAEGAERWDAGRLEKLGGNCLWVRADHEPDATSVGACWLLREQPGQEVWDVYEVTHYVSYPALS